MLDKIAPGNADALLLGFETSDDAAVYQLTDEIATLLTVDFFTPIVDDPYDFGRIAAANSLSDIYAMGGRPLTALNLLAFPCSLGAEIVGEVVRGGAEKVAEAGAVIVGGHTIDDKEPKFGLLGDRRRASRQGGAQRAAREPGDVLFLTKPIGTGIIGTAIKQGLENEDSRARRHRVDGDAQPARLRGDGRGRRARGDRRHRLRACSATCTRWPRGAAWARGSCSTTCRVFDRVRRLCRARASSPGRTHDLIEWAERVRRVDCRRGRRDAGCACSPTRRRAAAS